MSAKNRGGPARLDTEEVAVRFPRELLDALDAYIMDDAVGMTRPEAVRRIVRDWAETRGYMSRQRGVGRPDDEDERPSG